MPKQPQLQTLYPVGAQAQTFTPLVDIVAIHGLTGRFDGTWTSGDKLWLRDFLPQGMPRARIMSFYYDAALRGRAADGFNGLRGPARQLLDALHEKRPDEASTRPIIFICHSQGGLLLKGALVNDLFDSPSSGSSTTTAEENGTRSEYDEYVQHLTSALRGIVFMGTPHRGSSIPMLHYAKVLPGSDRVALLASEDVDELSFYKLNDDPVNERQRAEHHALKAQIDKRKHELVQLNYHFLKLFHASKGKSSTSSRTAARVNVNEFIIRSFIETASMGHDAKIVRPGDADLRYPGEDYEWFKTETLDNVSHTTMCKFGSAEDGNYLKVERALVEMTDYGPIASLGVCAPRAPMSGAEASSWVERAQYAMSMSQARIAASGPPASSSVAAAAMQLPFATIGTQSLPPANNFAFASPYARPSMAFRSKLSYVNASTSAAGTGSRYIGRGTARAPDHPPHKLESRMDANEDEANEDETSEESKEDTSGDSEEED